MMEFIYINVPYVGEIVCFFLGHKWIDAVDGGSEKIVGKMPPSVGSKGSTDYEGRNGCMRCFITRPFYFRVHNR